MVHPADKLKKKLKLAYLAYSKKIFIGGNIFQKLF